MYVCLCKGLTESDIQRLSQSGPLQPDCLIAALALDDNECCGRCARKIEELVANAANCWGCSTSRLPQSPY